jgi:oxygen-independent coproporphyrinogen-3 oxidase
MEDEAVRRLADAGFHRYEISNFCRPGFECRHNLLYWTGEEYIGLGPSAQSYLQSRRFGNISDLAQYVRALKAGRFPIADSESLSTERRRRERIIFGLRLIDGLDLHPSEEARSPESEWERRLNALIVDGLVEQDAGRIRLTDRGRRFADSVAVRLL